MSGEDTQDFCIGWKPFPCDLADLAFLFSHGAWKFTSGNCLSSKKYPKTFMFMINMLYN